MDDEDSAFVPLVGVRDEAELEQSIMQQADEEIRSRERKRDQKLLRLKRQKRDAEKEEEREFEELLEEEEAIITRLQGNSDTAKKAEAEAAAEENEHAKERLVETGKMTPFTGTTLVDNRPVVPEFTRPRLFTATRVHEVSKDGEATYNTSKSNNREDAFHDTFDGSDGDTICDEDGELYVDDGDMECYVQRLLKLLAVDQSDGTAERMTPVEVIEKSKENALSADSTETDAYFDGSRTFRLPGHLYSRLFEYQRVGIRWLLELYDQKVGGILGDEMGLGKTCQVVGFLATLFYSGDWNGCAMVVCPATVMKQWVQEFHSWFPHFRVSILHSSGSAFKHQNASGKGAKRLVEKMAADGHILILTYETLRLQRDLLLKQKWKFVILDEGHKIRNPDAEITLTCKQLPTPHRLILSGTPIQNKLVELWSLFDFIYPGRLGTLPVFEAQFSVPIRLGGYANASAIQVHTAFKCARILREMIEPYLLRRMKADVAHSMPKKTEQVLFCRLTPLQRSLYEDFLNSNEVQAIVEGRRQVLSGIDILRKICNHPDLLLVGNQQSATATYGHPKKSGKLMVVDSLLRTWHSEKHRVLLFSQTRQMLDILEATVRQRGYTYLRMDGAVVVKNRMDLIDRFNGDQEVFVFLLTTKVGGLGINLTGADRVLLYDPDWNPSTDMQARERAWRLGQQREVVVYRLMTSGTIEEKIYHRQIYKHFLTHKILKDPKQRRFFKSSDLYELFSLNVDDNGTNETQELFEEADHAASETAHVSKTDGDLLQSLFSDKNVHTVMEHDMIMDAHQPEQLLVEEEANRLAKESTEKLKKSFLLRKKEELSVPTWTGKFGKAGKAAASFEQSSSTSASLLENLRQRNRGTKVGGIQQERKPSKLPIRADTTVPLAEQVVQYLRSRNGFRASSQAIVSHFQLQVSGAEVPVFRALLRSVATFKKGDPGVWILKPEFTDIDENP